MPARYRIDSEHRVIFSAATGTLKDADLFEHRETLLADPAFDASFDQLWDFRNVDRVEVTARTIRSLAQARSFQAGARRAFVATRDAAYGMARMFQTLHGDAPEDLRVFRTLDEAKAWLGIG